MEIDSALTAIQTLRSELQDAKMAAVNTQLKPLPGESVSAARSASVGADVGVFHPKVPSLPFVLVFNLSL